MFAFPISKWVGGIFYEHTHRLLASAVGLLTTILAVWLWLKDSRQWMHWLGVAAFLRRHRAGNSRRPARDAAHGLARRFARRPSRKLFFMLTCAIALFTSRWWMDWRKRRNKFPCRAACARHVLYVTILIFVQLLIAATMRHQHAGLAISDFPLAYGKIWPDTSAGSHRQLQRAPRRKSTAKIPSPRFR